MLDLLNFAITVLLAGEGRAIVVSPRVPLIHAIHNTLSDLSLRFDEVASVFLLPFSNTLSYVFGSKDG